MLVYIFGAIADLAPSDKLLDIDSKIGLPHMLKKCKNSLTYTLMSCATRTMQFLLHKLVQTTGLRNHKLTNIWPRHSVTQLQAINFTKTEAYIITICLPSYLNHSRVALVLLALVNCSKPARFYGKHPQPCSVPIGPQQSCSLARKVCKTEPPYCGT